MGTDPSLAGSPSTTDFQLGVFAERLSSLQSGMQRLENTQQQTFGLIKEMNTAHNTSMLKLETVEQRTKTLEGDVVEHGGSIAKKAEESTTREIETALAQKASQAEVDHISTDVEDLKKSKWMVLGGAAVISALFAVAGVLISVGVKHLG